MRTRKATVIAASVGVAVAAATGVTYASSALESAPQSASIVQDAAPVAPRGGNGTGTEAGSNAANAPADAGSKESWSGSKKGEGQGESRGENREDFRGEKGRSHRDEGLIQVSGHLYPAEPGFCYTVLKTGIASVNFSVRNDSRKTVEFFPTPDCTGPEFTPVGAHTFNPAITVPVVGGVAAASFHVVDGHNEHH
ncbi:hypothetical protein [Streptomyces europaeiscabiei]|uniref:hypothetical protein n=1 Tax=Streptomyces europaeiscabiei TaxID=146819 RepID=UPI0029BF457B|nr:hypothetical protein [Streptomyces europaeiscabiei]MDX3777628.1 hypothetical protein [Streptomyces europaeiscabiei]